MNFNNLYSLLIEKIKLDNQQEPFKLVNEHATILYQPPDLNHVFRLKNSEVVKYLEDTMGQSPKNVLRKYFKGGFIRAKITSGESIKEFYSQKRLDKENFDQQVIDTLNSEKEYIINPNNYYYNHKRWPWSYINTDYMDEYGKFDPETKKTWKDIITNL